jgi:hypothetical protein
VSLENVDLGSSSDIPQSDDRVSSASRDEIQRRVLSDAVHAREMAMVIPDDLVLLQIPAFDGLVLTSTEEVRMAMTDHQASNR